MNREKQSPPCFLAEACMYDRIAAEISDVSQSTASIRPNFPTLVRY